MTWRPVAISLACSAPLRWRSWLDGLGRSVPAVVLGDDVRLLEAMGVVG